MSQTDTQQRSGISQRAQAAQGRNDVALRGPRLPFDERIEQRFGVDRTAWKTLVEMIFPTVEDPNVVVLALSYCRQRGLDVFKRPVHIVPMWNKTLGRMVSTVWPGISELRTTAFRTKEYAGCDPVEFGPDITKTFTGRVKGKDGWKEESKEVTFPQWAQMTVYRMVNGQRCAFVGPKVFWLEDYSDISNSGVPNQMWEQRARGQLEKVAEAAALRRAFPEECGGDYAAEEMEGKTTDAYGTYAPQARGQTSATHQQQPDQRTRSRPDSEKSTVTQRNEERQAQLDEQPNNKEPDRKPPAGHDPQTGEVIEGEYTDLDEEDDSIYDNGEPTPEQVAESKGAASTQSDEKKQTNLTPEQMLIWADAQFAGVTDPDELEPLFNNTVAPRFENKQYGHLWNDLLAIQRKHENRLTP